MFIENLGPIDPKVRYQVKIGAQTAWLTTAGIVFEAQVEPHDPLYALVVDPTVLYSTFLGGSAGNPGFVCANSCAWVLDEVANGVGVDSAGNAYVARYTASTDFPTTTGVVQATTAGRTAFVTKLNATGSALVYSTYLGNATNVRAIAVDSKGNAYLTGETGNGSAFPTTFRSRPPSPPIPTRHTDCLHREWNSSRILTQRQSVTAHGAGYVPQALGLRNPGGPAVTFHPRWSASPLPNGPGSHLPGC